MCMKRRKIAEQNGDAAPADMTTYYLTFFNSFVIISVFGGITPLYNDYHMYNNYILYYYFDLTSACQCCLVNIVGKY